MAQVAKKVGSDASELWEDGKLGRDEEFAAVADAALESALDEASGLQMISIRLQRALIEDLKFIARAHGIGYQPLIRDILSRFVVHEAKEIIRLTNERREAEARQEALQTASDSRVSGSKAKRAA